MPFVPSDTLTLDLRGSYKQLNDRLRTLDREARSKTLFETETVVVPASTDSTVTAGNVKTPLDENALCDWLETTSRTVGIAGELADLSDEHRGLIIESYTSLQAADPEDFKTSVDAIDAGTGNLDLPGGRHVGIFLHEAIEKLDFESFDDAPDLKSWMALDDVRESFASIMRRHGVDDPRWLDRGRELVFNTLSSRVALAKRRLKADFAGCLAFAKWSSRIRSPNSITRSRRWS